LITLDHRDAVVRLWHVATATELRKFTVLPAGSTQRHAVWRATIAPDGQTLVATYQPSQRSGLGGGAVVNRLWDITTGQQRAELAGHSHYVEGLAYSPDSKLFVTCGPGGGAAPGGFRGGAMPLLPDHVFVWDVATGQRIAALPEGLPKDGIVAAFAP